MKAQLTWTGGMKFEATSDGHQVALDAKAPIGSSSAMTPKELVAVGLAGCTAMDVVALLKKHKQHHQSLDVAVDISTSTGSQPIVFTGAALTFNATGEIDQAVLIEAVRLSQTKYCGVSAMLAQAFPITYTVVLNGAEVATGAADFGGKDE